MKSEKHDRLIVFLVGIFCLCLTALFVWISAIDADAAGGAGTYKFTIGANPYTDDLIGSGVNYLVDTMDFRYGSTVVKGWTQRVGNTYTVSASSSSSVVFGFDNWTGLTIFYNFVDSSGKVVYTHEAVASGYGTINTTYVYASDLPSTGTYTVVPSSGGIPYSSSVTGTITFYASLPDGASVLLVDISAADSGIVGGAYEITPDFFPEVFKPVNGCLPTDMNQRWYICDKNSRTVYVAYSAVGDGRFLTINYYDKYGDFLTSRNIEISQEGATLLIPPLGTYDVIPQKYYYRSGTNNITLTVYCDDFDTSGAYDSGYAAGSDAGYDLGYDLGYKDGISGSEDSYALGYGKGLRDGLMQNSLTADQFNDITEDYNAITGFFDGMWSWMKNLFDTVTEGVGFGGVTVGTVIWTLVIIAVVTFGLSKLHI